jgi:hypothetical protein
MQRTMPHSKDNPPQRPDRVGKHVLAGHFTHASVVALQKLAVQLHEKTAERVTTHQLLAAGAALLLKQYGKRLPPELADLSKLPAPPRHPSKSARTRDPPAQDC